MIITIKVDDEEVLRALNKAFKHGGRPDELESVEYIDEQDIEQWILPGLEVKGIEIER